MNLVHGKHLALTDVSLSATKLSKWLQMQGRTPYINSCVTCRLGFRQRGIEEALISVFKFIGVMVLQT